MNNKGTFQPLSLSWRDQLYGGFDTIPPEIIEENEIQIKIVGAYNIGVLTETDQNRQKLVTIG